MRPIDADALMHELGFDEKDFVPVQSNAKSTVDIVLILTKYAINNSPTVTFDDVRPHGRWEECDYVEYDGHGECIHFPRAALRCTNCCNAFKKELLWKDNFCPNCGADMRGGGDDA